MSSPGSSPPTSSSSSTSSRTRGAYACMHAGGGFLHGHLHGLSRVRLLLDLYDSRVCIQNYIHIHPHRFEREGDDLVHTANVTLEEALTGVDVSVQTLDGRTLRCVLFTFCCCVCVVAGLCLPGLFGPPVCRALSLSHTHTYTTNQP